MYMWSNFPALDFWEGGQNQFNRGIQKKTWSVQGLSIPTKSVYI